jgi:hypothetical protein
MFGLFVTGLAAPFLPEMLAAGLVALAFVALMVLDPLAARRDEAPAFFARLRPVQLAIPVASLIAIIALRV